ncbi:MAG: hypothetical protein MN733_08280 [Nitrososphaera sp.]|nr:hypothetical protein [Nitrososphaera sp.]
MHANNRAVSTALLLSLTLSGCAPTKSFVLDVKTEDGGQKSTIEALKCAARSSGWSLTYADENSVSAQQTVGMDNVPLTLNLVLQSDNPSKVVMTTHNPRGLSGSMLHERPVIEALKTCGTNVQLVR